MLDSGGMRERLFTMRMSDEESQRLDALAKHYALNAAGVLRMLVKREYDAVQPRAVSDLEKFITAPMPQKKKPKK